MAGSDVIRAFKRSISAAEAEAAAVTKQTNDNYWAKYKRGNKIAAAEAMSPQAAAAPAAVAAHPPTATPRVALRPTISVALIFHVCT